MLTGTQALALLKSKLSVLFFLLAAYSNTMLAQEKNLLNLHYAGGSDFFYRDMAEMIDYGNRNVNGVAVVIFEVTASKVISVRHASTLDTDLQKNIEEALRQHEAKWSNLQDTLQFVLPVKFTRSGADYFVDTYPSHFLKEIAVLGYSLSTASDVSGARIKPDEVLVKRLNQAVEKKKYKKAVKQLDELLQRNPVSLQLRETRIYCLNQLERYEEACEDIAFIKEILRSDTRQNCINP